MRLILVRHTETDAAPGHCYGRLDVGLSPAGHAALEPLSADLRATGVTRVLTSPARRCRALATLLSADPIVDDRLQELDFGAWEGLAWDDVPRDRLDDWAADPAGFAAPGGESGADLCRRVAAFCTEQRTIGQDAIVVSHGGPLRIMPALWRGETPDLLAPTPKLGTILHVQASAVSPAHSATTAHPPNTSPVKPPI